MKQAREKREKNVRTRARGCTMKLTGCAEEAPDKVPLLLSSAGHRDESFPASPRHSPPGDPPRTNRSEKARQK